METHNNFPSFSLSLSPDVLLYESSLAITKFTRITQNQTEQQGSCDKAEGTRKERESASAFQTRIISDASNSSSGAKAPLTSQAIFKSPTNIRASRTHACTHEDDDDATHRIVSAPVTTTTSGYDDDP